MGSQVTYFPTPVETNYIHSGNQVFNYVQIEFDMLKQTSNMVFDFVHSAGVLLNKFTWGNRCRLQIYPMLSEPRHNPKCLMTPSNSCFLTPWIHYAFGIFFPALWVIRWPIDLSHVLFDHLQKVLKGHRTTSTSSPFFTKNVENFIP